MYRVRIMPTALRQLAQLPEKVRPALLEAIGGPILENPFRAGRPLRAELEGRFVARRGEYRIVYRVKEGTRTIEVTRIEHRRGVYRPR